MPHKDKESLKEYRREYAKKNAARYNEQRNARRAARKASGTLLPSEIRCQEKARERIRAYRDAMAKEPLWNTWKHMLERCYNANHIKFHHYGGRGIAVCERWRNDRHAFYTDMGVKPSPTHTLDRINNDGDYEPSNCRWATKSEQRKNSRSLPRKPRAHPIRATA